MTHDTKKVVENIPKRKIETVKELADLIKSKRTVLIADISGIPGSQFQQISKKLRGKAKIKIPKKNLLSLAIKKAGIEKTKEIDKKFAGANAILFSEMDSYKLAGELIKRKTPSKAKVGQIAPTDIEVPAGPTDLVPGPAISELGALGIQIQIQGGKIEIKEPKVVAKEGEEISQGAADILSKLDIKPFTIGFSPICAYDSEDEVFYEEIIIDSEKTIESLKDSFARSLGFAVEIGYVCNDSVKIMIQKAGAHEKRLSRVISGEPEEVVESVSESSEKEDETPKIEKEEEKADASAGLASLFG
jgi:large subunit ribosomal protein L10